MSYCKTLDKEGLVNGDVIIAQSDAQEGSSSVVVRQPISWYGEETMVAREEEIISGAYGHASTSTPVNTDTRIEQPKRLSEESHEPRRSSYSAGRNDRTLIAVVDEHSFTRECITGFLQELDDTLDVISFASSAGFLQSTKLYDIILYCDRKANLNHDTENQKSTELESLVEIAPVIILSSVDYHGVIVKALEIGARALIPAASTTPRQVIEIIRLIKAGGIFVPASLYVQRVNGSDPTPPTNRTYDFSPRELKVLEHLMRGKANKTIAFELQMSESTVKVHMKSIMSKLSATNRTEVVCRAYDLAGIGALSRREGYRL
jgi:DNA-binding NarL/FixJ family response regulator